MMKFYRTVKEVLIFLNLVLGAVLMAVLLYFGAAAMSALSELGGGGEAPPPGPAEQSGECPPGESYSSETGLCYPDIN
jgi:hypothetical protein